MSSTNHPHHARQQQSSSYKRAQSAWAQRGGLSIYAKLVAMVSLGQLMRIAEYTAGLKARIGGFFSENTKSAQEQQEELFLCDVDYPYPTALPGMRLLEQTLKDVYASS